MKTIIPFTSFFLITGLEGLGVAAFLYSLPADPKHAFWGGFSPTRLALLGLAFLVSVACLAAAFSWRSRRLAGFFRLVTRWLADGDRLLLVFCGMTAAGLGLAFSAGMLVDGRLGTTYETAERLVPFLGWGTATCFQLALLMLLACVPLQRMQELVGQKSLLLWGLGLAAAFPAAWAVLVVTGLGFRPDVTEWLHPNSPVMVSQVVAALAVALVLAWVARRWFLTRRTLWLDILLATGLWLATVLLWNSVTLNPSFFNPRPFPPNYEFYPYSDARDYDMLAQQMLVGEGYGGRQLIIRPLYAFSLAVYHTLAGQDYQQVMLLQVLVLAFLPVVIYFIGRNLHSRTGGVIAGVLILLRERNAIALGGLIPGAHSHARLMMTDVPAALGVAVFTLLGVIWLQQPERRRLMPLLAGGALGALVLIRSQAVVLLPAAVIIAVLLLFKRWRLWLAGGLLMGLGAASFVIPWLVRDYLLTGMAELETAPSLAMGIEVNYYTGLPITGPLPGERGDAYNARMTGILREYMLSHPGEVLGSTAAHFFHDEINTALLLPLNPDTGGLLKYVTGHSFWFGDLEIHLSATETAALVLNLALVGLGLGAAWGMGRKAVLAPVMMHAGYNLSTALARRSGGRYFLPGDWVGILLYALGLAQLIAWLAILLTSRGKENGSDVVGEGESRPWIGGTPVVRRHLLQGGLLAAAILAGGSLLPVSELLIPQRYAPQTSFQMLASLAQRGGNQTDLSRLESFIKDPQAAGLWGRGLWPRYMAAGEGIRSYEPYIESNRLSFRVVSSQPGDVLLPRLGQPDVFPNGADVAAFGCLKSSYLDAYLVVVLDPSGDHYYWREPMPDKLRCPVVGE